MLPDVKLPMLPAKTPKQTSCWYCPHAKRRKLPYRGCSNVDGVVCTLTGEMPVPQCTGYTIWPPLPPPKWCPL